MKGLKLSVPAIIFQTIDFLKESFVEASLAMASLCGLNVGHIWSNYLTRKQLSVILKGEVFQLINLLKPFGLTTIYPQGLVFYVAQERERHCMRLLCRTQTAPLLTCVQGISRN